MTTDALSSFLRRGAADRGEVAAHSERLDRRLEEIAEPVDRRVGHSIPDHSIDLVRPAFDQAPLHPAFFGDAIVVQPSPRPEAVDRLGPVVFGPCPGGPDHPGYVEEMFTDDCALTAVEWFGDQEANVRISPPLPQDRDELP